MKLSGTKNIAIVSGYKSMAPFNDSMNLILSGAFEKNKILSYEFFDFDGYAPSKDFDTMLFLMTPEKFCSYIEPSNLPKSRCIVWNVEPVGEKVKKFVSRADSMKDILDNYDVELWVFNEDQVSKSHISGKKSVYVPIGFDSKIVPKKQLDKHYGNRVLFLGHQGTPNRVRFLGQVRAYSYKNKSKFITIKPIGNKTYLSLGGNCDSIHKYISRFSVGLDIESYDGGINFNPVRWHRLCVYAACGILVMSDCRLEKYGFKSGKHYIHFDNSASFIREYNGIRHDKARIRKICGNMFEKISKDYSMHNIIRGLL